MSETQDVSIHKIQNELTLDVLIDYLKLIVERHNKIIPELSRRFTDLNEDQDMIEKEMKTNELYSLEEELMKQYHHLFYWMKFLQHENINPDSKAKLNNIISTLQNFTTDRTYSTWLQDVKTIFIDMKNLNENIRDNDKRNVNALKITENYLRTMIDYMNYCRETANDCFVCQFTRMSYITKNNVMQTIDIISDEGDSIGLRVILGNFKSIYFNYVDYLANNKISTKFAFNVNESYRTPTILNEWIKAVPRYNDLIDRRPKRPRIGKITWNQIDTSNKNAEKIEEYCEFIAESIENLDKTKANEIMSMIRDVMHMQINFKDERSVQFAANVFTQLAQTYNTIFSELNVDDAKKIKQGQKIENEIIKVKSKEPISALFTDLKSIEKNSEKLKEESTRLLKFVRKNNQKPNAPSTISWDHGTQLILNYLRRQEETSNALRWFGSQNEIGDDKGTRRNSVASKYREFMRKFHSDKISNRNLPEETKEAVSELVPYTTEMYRIINDNRSMTGGTSSQLHYRKPSNAFQ
jgi:hypothetical protein